MHGFKSIHFLRREVGQEVEFVTIMLLDSLEAIREFACEDYEAAVVPAKARAVLPHFDERSKYYENVVEQTGIILIDFAQRRRIMDSSIQLFKTSKGQAEYYAAYDAALGLWPVPYETHFVTTPYGQTHVISCGPDDAYPLVLLHAGQASATMWFPNIADLCRNFHVLALDTPGEPGKSVPARHNATRRDCADWLVGVLDALGISNTHIMGLSRGGWLALNLALYVPDRLERIVLLSPAAVFVALNSFFSAVAQAVMRVPTRFVSKVALNSWVARGFVVNDVFAEQFMIGLQNWNWAVNTSGYSGVMPCRFSDEELRQIHQNVLLLIGDQDRLNPPKAMERARQTIPHLEAEIIPQAGHFLNMEQPGSVNARILEFLIE